MPAESPVRHGDGTRYDLIETLRWERGAGFVRLDQHLERLRASADSLGFPYEATRIRSAMEACLRDAPMLRVRIALAADGGVQCTATPFLLQAPETLWWLRVAQTRLDSNDPLLRHKTSRRAAYERARAEFASTEADEVVLLNEKEQVCEGAITTIFADLGDGVLKTPALSCGLLAGVLRAEMITTGQAVEAVLSPQDLHDAKALFVGNSLRGLIRARLEEER